jgi:hypothetical protein
MTAHLRIAGIMIAGTTLFGCAATDGAKAKPSASAAFSKDPSCLTDTGSRIAPPPGTQCRGTGRSYSNEDIQRTGSTSAADALSLLDSSVTVHH